MFSKVRLAIALIALLSLLSSVLVPFTLWVLAIDSMDAPAFTTTEVVLSLIVAGLAMWVGADMGMRLFFILMYVAKDSRHHLFRNMSDTIYADEKRNNQPLFWGNVVSRWEEQMIFPWFLVNRIRYCMVKVR